MTQNSKIEWTDATWNPIVGCSIVSPGCTNCYAMAQAGRLLDKPGSHYEGTTKTVNGKAVWTGKVALASDKTIEQPLRVKKPTMWFVNSMGDVFHEDVPDAWIDRVYAVMALAPHHVYQVLTKRPDRMRDYMTDDDAYRRILRAADPLRSDRPRLTSVPISNPMHYAFWPRLWLGTSVERQKEADERIPDLIETPAAVRFLSCEPLLGPIDLTPWINDINWVIVGGESGPNARPMHPDWARSIRDQCLQEDVAFFFKQWGEWRPPLDGEMFDTSAGEAQKVPAFIVATNGTVHCYHNNATSDGKPMLRVGKKRAGRELDGETWDQFPRGKKTDG